MKTVVCLSGGLDSTVLATYLQRSELHELRSVSFSYGQRHERAELMAARNVAGHLGIPHKVLSLNGIMNAVNPESSALLAASSAPGVPEGHYAEDNMRATVVPGRNLLMIAAATAYAKSWNYAAVAMAAHAGDHPVYPDCRPDFLMAAGKTTALGYGVYVIFPFADQTKTQIVETGIRHDAPLHLTWSCYNGGEIHCGRCGTCVERYEAFRDAQVPDPTQYADTTLAEQVTT